MGTMLAAGGEAMMYQVDVCDLAQMTESEAHEWKARVGNAANSLRIVLYEGYTREAWRALGYADWTECVKALAEEFGLSERHIWRLHSANETENLLTPGSVGEIPEKQLRPLSSLPPEQQVAVWQHAVETAPNGKITTEYVQEIVNEFKSNGNGKHGSEDWGELIRGPIGNYRIRGDVKQCETCRQLWAADLDYCPYCNISREARVLFAQRERQGQDKVPNHVNVTLFSHKSKEYYTPKEYADAARVVMGKIDLDPASCEEAQKNIGAKKYYTEDDNGLSKTWSGAIWLNPPYSKTEGESNQAIWSHRLVSEYESGNVIQAILLVKAALGYKWFEELWDIAPAVCFARNRLSFILEDGTDEGQSKQGTAFFYFGNNIEKFIEVFTRFGRVIAGDKIYQCQGS